MMVSKLSPKDRVVGPLISGHYYSLMNCMGLITNLVVWGPVVWDSIRDSPKNPNPFYKEIPGIQGANPNHRLVTS